MSLIIEAAELRKALTWVRPATRKFPGNFIRIEPVEGSDEICVEACNGELRIATLVPAGVGPGEWPIYLPIRYLATFVASLDRDAWLTINADDDKKATISSYHDYLETTHEWLHGAGAEAAVRAMPDVEERWDRPDDVTTWSASGGAISAMRAAAVAASDDVARPVLTQVLASGDGEWVATDSYQLTRIKGPVPPDEITIPEWFIRAIPKDADEAVVSYDLPVTASDRWSERGRFLEFACDNATTLQARRHTLGEFPNYKGLVPTRQVVGLELDRDKAIRQMSALKAWGANGIKPGRLHWNGEHIEWHCKEWGDTGTVRSGVMPATDRFDGASPQITVAFNPEYFLNGLRSVPGPIVHFDLVDNLKPAILRDPESTHMFLLMPVRVS